MHPSGRCFLLGEEGLCMDNFGNETALLFGAYRGAAGLQDSYFDGFVSAPLPFAVLLLLLVCWRGTVSGCQGTVSGCQMLANA